MLEVLIIYEEATHFCLDDNLEKCAARGVGTTNISNIFDVLKRCPNV
jgi:hypothetical protein